MTVSPSRFKRGAPSRFTQTLASVALVLTLFPSWVSAQSFVCTFVGKSGKPLNKVEASLVPLEGAPEPRESKRTRSNKQGIAKFNKTGPGPYRLQSQLKGYAPLRLTVHPGKEASIRRVLLRRKEFEKSEQQAIQALEAGEFDAAIEGLKNLIDYYPEDAVLHDNLARSYAGKLDRENALTEGEIAGKLDPARFASTRGELEQQILHRLGNQALHALEFDFAEIHFNTLKGLNPNSPAAYHGLALAYGHQGKVRKALEAITRAVELDPGNPQLQNIKATIEAAAGKAP